jgi:hypothetical protein
MYITSMILYIVPRKTYRNFPIKSTDVLKPIYSQLISPFALLFGGLIIFNVLWLEEDVISHKPDFT